MSRVPPIDLIHKMSYIHNTENLTKKLYEILSASEAVVKLDFYKLIHRREAGSKGQKQIAYTKLFCDDPVYKKLESGYQLFECYSAGKIIKTKSRRDRYELWIPILDNNNVIQIIYLLLAYIDSDLSDSIDKLIDIYRNQVSILNEKDRDYLTRLYNRKYLNKVLRDIQYSSGRKEDRQADFFLAILDIDHFKRVNDTYGHLIGDEVLVRFSRVVEEAVRKEDYAFRYGGEEFCILIKNSTKKGVVSLLERLRITIEGTDFPRCQTITVSIGFVRMVRENDPFSLSDMADRALYYAKEHGRNQVCSYDWLVEKGEIQPIAGPVSDVSLWG